MLSIGIVGLPNVGKSTLFNALTKSSVLAANYPFATIEPNVGIVPVPDSRLQRLSEIYNGAKITPATVQFVDIAGLVAGASRGEGLGNQFLAHIRNASVIVEVIRSFRDNQVTHVNDIVDPKSDMEVILTELALADLNTVSRRLSKVEKEAKANPKLVPMLQSIKSALKLLEDGIPVCNNLKQEDLVALTDLHLLTAKPIIYAFNVDEDILVNDLEQANLKSIVAPADAIFISAKLESELSNLEDYDSTELRESYGMNLSGLETLVLSAYKTLGLQSFLTAGEKEVRAWTIPKGAKAPEAAEAIHSDMQRGFIAAEIISFDDLDKLGTLSACRAAGKIRTEGKNYIMQPNDIVEFRFNV